MSLTTLSAVYTNDLSEGFTKRYHVHKLVYYNLTEDITTAIEREKQIKNWKRIKKIQLIDSFNPDWHDLFEEICS